LSKAQARCKIVASANLARRVRWEQRGGKQTAASGICPVAVPQLSLIFEPAAIQMDSGDEDGGFGDGVGIAFKDP